MREREREREREQNKTKKQAGFKISQIFDIRADCAECCSTIKMSCQSVARVLPM